MNMTKKKVNKSLGSLKPITVEVAHIDQINISVDEFNGMFADWLEELWQNNVNENSDYSTFEDYVYAEMENCTDGVESLDGDVLCNNEIILKRRILEFILKGDE